MKWVVNICLNASAVTNEKTEAHNGGYKRPMCYLQGHLNQTHEGWN